MEHFTELDAATIQVARRNELVERLSSLRTADASDVCLVCQEKEFYAHRLVLSSSSPYFAAMFGIQMKEKDSGRVVFNEMEVGTLEAILDYIYLGKVENIKTEADYMQVAAASHLMRLEKLFQYCCNYLGNRLSLSNFFAIFHTGELYESTILRSKTQEFWLINCDKLLATKDFILLSDDEMKTLINYLRFKGLCLDDVLAGVIKWLRHNLKARENLAPSLFKCMDCKLLSKSFVQSLLQNQELIKCSHVISSEIKELGLLTFISGTDILPPKPLADSNCQAWGTKVTYFSLRCAAQVFDPNPNCEGLPVVAEHALSRMCVQQLDLKTMTWLSPRYPDLDFCTNKFKFQYKDYIFMLDSKKKNVNCRYDLQCKHSEHFFISDRPFVLPNSLTCYFKGLLYAFGGFNTRIYYMNPSLLSPPHQCEEPLHTAPPLLLPQSNCFTVLSSSRFIYVVGSESYSPDELSVQYSSDPISQGRQWDVTLVLKNGLHPDQFFVLNDALNALYLSESHCKHLVFNHDSETFTVKRNFHWPAAESGSLRLSKFQNPQCSFVFFSKKDDFLHIPCFHWEPETGLWTKLPTPVNKSVIRNCDDGVKMFYYF